MFSLYFPPLLYPVVCYHPSYSHPKQMNAGLQEARVWWINFYQKIWQQIEDDEFRLGLRILTPFLSRKISKVQDGPGCIEQVQSPRPFDQNNHKEGYGKDAYSPGQNTVVGSLSLLQGNLPSPLIELRSPALQADSLPAEPQAKPKNTGVGKPFPSPADISDPGIEPRSPALQVDYLPTELSGKPW